MKKVKLVILTLLLATTLSTEVFAEPSSKIFTDDQITITNTIEPKGVSGATVNFVNPEKKQTREIVPFAGERYVYKYSEYQVISKVITSYNVGPREKDIFLISVPKGVTKTLSDSKTISASIKFRGLSRIRGVEQPNIPAPPEISPRETIMER